MDPRRAWFAVGKYTIIPGSVAYMLFKLTTNNSEQVAKGIKQTPTSNYTGSSRDQTAMMVNMLKGGGASDLSRLREQTTQKRYKVAEDNTVYNVKTSSENEEKSKEK